MLVSGYTHYREGKRQISLLYIKDNKITKLIQNVPGELYGGTKYRDFYIFGTRSETPALIVLNEKFKLIKTKALPERTDTHCLLIKDDKLHVVSSAEDKILMYNPSTLEYIDSYVFGKGYNKRYHLNDVILNGDNYIYTAFRDYTNGEPFLDINSGKVKTGNLIVPETNETLVDDLVKPHSPVYHDGQIYVCDSMRGGVKRGEVTIYQEKDRWTRGLLVDDEKIVVGSVKTIVPEIKYLSELVFLDHHNNIFNRIQLPLNGIYSILDTN